jgi:hypothetical protein
MGTERLSLSGFGSNLSSPGLPNGTDGVESRAKGCYFRICFSFGGAYRLGRNPRMGLRVIGIDGEMSRDRPPRGFSKSSHDPRNRSSFLSQSLFLTLPPPIPIPNSHFPAPAIPMWICLFSTFVGPYREVVKIVVLRSTQKNVNPLSSRDHIKLHIVPRCREAQQPRMGWDGGRWVYSRKLPPPGRLYVLDTKLYCCL